MFTETVALVCLGWYLFIALVCTIGYIQLFIQYRQNPERASVLSNSEDDIPHVTVIRPCKGYEPYLYECLAATFQQDYPKTKLTIYFCISARSDPAFPTLERVLRDYPDHDARILVEEEDPALVEDSNSNHQLGPNPKIRNMSRAYREAKGDLIWVIDCNVWVSRGACSRIVDKICGYSSNRSKKRPYKLVHHLPISVDVEQSSNPQGQPASTYDDTSRTPLQSSSSISKATILGSLNAHGGRLEELFLASSHAKMYVAISSVAVAPCIVGKSNMFRASHLNALTQGQGIDYFSHNICEDHLIGDLLWRSHIPNTADPTLKFKNHGLVFGDLAIQPVAGMSVANYIARRVRWLRVRKFTVPVATLVEPGTESFLCSLYGAFGATTVPYTKRIVGDSWLAMLLLWLTSIAIWAAVDWTVYLLLHSGRTVEMDHDATEKIPPFARPLQTKIARRPWSKWARAWLGREALALPIWAWAVCGGATVTWRERQFWVGMDMRVHAVDDEKQKRKVTRGSGMKAVNGYVVDKTRTD